MTESMHSLRQIAIGAARSQLRRQHELAVEYCTAAGVALASQAPDADAALAVLDDIARSDPTLLASVWYRKASARQIALFRKEWK